MNKLQKARLLDKILLKFEGNKSYSWDAIHSPEFYKDLHEDYYVIENHLNFLVGDGMLRRSTVSPSMPETLSMTDKGFAVMTDLKNLGYVQKYQGEIRIDKREESTLFYAKNGFWVAVISTLIALFAFFKCDGV